MMISIKAFRMTHPSILRIAFLLALNSLANGAPVTTCVCMNRGVSATYKAACNSGQLLAVRKTSLGQMIGVDQSCGTAGSNQVNFDSNDCFTPENLNVRWQAKQSCNNLSITSCSFVHNYYENDFSVCNSWAQGYRYSCLVYECIPRINSDGVDDSFVEMTSGGRQSYNVVSRIQLRTPQYPSLTRSLSSRCSLIVNGGITSIVRIYDRRGRYLSGDTSPNQCPYQVYVNSVQTYSPWCSATFSDFVEATIYPASGQQRIDIVFQQPSNNGNAEGALWAVIETNSRANVIECGSDIPLLPVPSATTTTTTSRPTTTTFRPTTTSDVTRISVNESITDSEGNTTGGEKSSSDAIIGGAVGGSLGLVLIISGAAVVIVLLAKRRRTRLSDPAKKTEVIMDAYENLQGSPAHPPEDYERLETVGTPNSGYLAGEAEVTVDAYENLQRRPARPPKEVSAPQIYETLQT